MAALQRLAATRARPEDKKIAQLQALADTHTPAQRFPIQRQPTDLKTQMGATHGVDLSGIKEIPNSSFPASVGALATIQGNRIHYAPSQFTTANRRHELGHAIDNAKNGTPKGDTIVNGKNVDTTRENAAQKIADTPFFTHNRPEAINSVTQKKSNGKQDLGFEDNRPESIVQRKLQEMVNNSLPVSQLRTSQKLHRNSQIIQRNPAAAPAIAGGHAYRKHVVEQKEWGDPPMDPAAFRGIVSDVMKNPDKSKTLNNGRKAYWKGDTMVIYDPNTSDKGTCFKPTLGETYYCNGER